MNSMFKGKKKTHRRFKNFKYRQAMKAAYPS